MSVPAVNEMHYAAGWLVNADQTIIEHPGGNPNFSSEVTLLPNERTAVCLLTNGANTNISLVLKVKDILDGNHRNSYFAHRYDSVYHVLCLPNVHRL